VLNELEKLAPASNLNTAARDFAGITHWINSEPLTIQSLRGKVVLVDFWTYSCINCIRTFPYLKRWYETYKDDGFVIVGVHSPEFAFEKEAENVERATKREGILYPVAIDNDFATWRAFHNVAWPGHFLIDKDGVIREAHHGEGDYEQTEALIRKLLGKAPTSFKAIRSAIAKDETPETYLGYARAKAYDPSLVLEKDVAKTYEGTKKLAKDQVTLNGEFMVSKESITSMKDGSILTLNFAASHVYLVMSGASQTPVRISQDGRLIGQVFVKEDKMYELLNLQGHFGRHLLTLEIPKGISAFAFTFGDD